MPGQNPVATPLPADLPENWGLGQIVSPSGVDVGLTQQHGYNYLMKQVNDAQEAVNQIGEELPNLTTAQDVEDTIHEKVPQLIQEDGGGYEVIPSGEDVPVESRKENILYLQVV